MSDQEQNRIFSENLNRILEERGKSQSEVARAIGVSPQTFNTWVKGIAVPRMGKIQKLSDYFGIPKSRLIEESHVGYYYAPDTAEIAEYMRRSEEMSMLFDAARDADPEDLKAIYNMLLALKRKERHDD